MDRPDPQRLALLTDLRQEAGLNLTQMARRCGLRGKQSHQTAGAWERGIYVPSERRRTAMIGYLWDDLLLRTDAARFEAVWRVLETEWGWTPISDEEWRAFTTQPRPVKAEPSAVHAPFQAPAASASFVGREAIVSSLLQRLTDDTPVNSDGHPQPVVAGGKAVGYPSRSSDQSGPEAVALVGMGGIGKSTLAARVAGLVRAHFADGVLWAHTQASEPLDVLNSWAKAFGHDYSTLSDVQSRASAMRSLLDDKQVLIVLDDVHSPTRVEPLLPGHGRCRLLVTTRSADVASALGCAHVLLPELESAESLALLMQLVGPDRVNAELVEAQAICALLHNLPLAIEMVGQLLAARPRRQLADMRARLEDARGRLDLHIADRDVRTSFQVSWAALDAVHQRTFAHMALFQGRSFTTAALAAVLQEPPPTVEEQVEMLAARSLVSLAENDRYRQHPLLADFAHEQLDPSRELWLRYAESHLAMARQAGGDPTAIDAEWDNLIAGMRAAADQNAAALTIAYASTLTDLWFTSGRFSDARQGYAWAAAAAATIQASEHAFLLCRWGRACFEQDAYGEAQALVMEAQTLAQARQDRAVEGECAFWIGRIALEQGDYGRAGRFLDASEAIYQALEEVGGLALVYYQQAQLHYDLGDLDQAVMLCQRTVSMQDPTVDPTVRVATLRLLADVAIEQGDLDAADAHCLAALALCERLQSRAELAATEYSLAVIARLRGQLEPAHAHAARSLTLCRALGLRAFAALALYEQSRVYALAQDFDQAYARCTESIRIYRELGRTFNLVYALNHLGQICLSLARPEQARRQWRDALALAEQLDHPLREEIRARLTAAIA